MTPEGKVKKAMTTGLDQLEAYWFFPATHGYGRSGVPDIIACIDGYFYAFECKAKGRGTTALQDKEIENITLAGGRAYVVTGVDDAEDMLCTLERILRRKRDKRLGRTAAKSRGSKEVPRLRAD